MKNPGVQTLLTFLKQVRKHEPANFSTLSRERRKGYGMLRRYLDYCLVENLIIIHSTIRTRGRYPSKKYSITKRGEALLELFTENMGQREYA